MFQRVSTGAVAGFLVGLVLVVVLMNTRTHSSSDDEVEGSVPSAEAAASFVADWQRMRAGVWTVDSKFVRSNATGQSLAGDIHEAQRAPTRMRTSFGTTTIELPDKTISCAPDANGSKGACREVPTSLPWDESVRQEVASVESLVSGDRRQYSVRNSKSDCYRLEATSGGSMTWGQQAEYCFDERTGAIASSEITQIAGTDQVTSVTTAVSITSDVQDSDFRAPSK